MENHLKEINSVLGVVGSFICLPDGSIAGKVLPEAFDAASVETAARVLTQTLNALETSGQRIVETDLVYGHGRLLLKNLRGGILTIVCAHTINVPLLNLTANGIAKKIASELKPAKPVTAEAIASSAANKSAGLDVSAGEIRPAPAEVTAGSVSSANEIRPAPAEVTVDLEVPSEEIRRAQAEVPADLDVPSEEIRAAQAEVPARITAPPSELADDRFFNELTRELTRVIGPVSSIIVEDEIDTLKERRKAFPKSRAAELVARVSLAIHDEAKRGKFIQVMSTITQRP
jgi:predicted regulator of Ras-like GTPase activity (Roadblock/LC7/MglB family)